MLRGASGWLGLMKVLWEQGGERVFRRRERKERKVRKRKENGGGREERVFEGKCEGGRRGY